MKIFDYTNNRISRKVEIFNYLNVRIIREVQIFDYSNIQTFERNFRLPIYESGCCLFLSSLNSKLGQDSTILAFILKQLLAHILPRDLFDVLITKIMFISYRDAIFLGGRCALDTIFRRSFKICAWAISCANHRSHICSSLQPRFYTVSVELLR